MTRACIIAPSDRRVAVRALVQVATIHMRLLIRGTRLCDHGTLEEGDAIVAQDLFKRLPWVVNHIRPETLRLFVFTVFIVFFNQDADSIS